MKTISRYQAGIILAVNFAAMFLLWRYPEALALATLALGVLLLRLRPRVRDYLVTVLAGFLMEIIVVHVGIWEYDVPSIWGVPLWIPLAWGNLVAALHIGLRDGSSRSGAA